MRWQSTHKAQLLYLIDNEDPVVQPDEGPSGRGSVSCEYSVDSAPTHTIEWSMWFSEKELSKLEAVAVINDGPEQVIGSTDEDLNRWHGIGVARRKA